MKLMVANTISPENIKCMIVKLKINKNKLWINIQIIIYKYFYFAASML